MRVPNCVGKALILALSILPLAACDQGLPFSGGRSETIAQSSVTDPQLRAFYQARQWQAAWDRKSEKVLLDTIGGALAHGLKPSLFLQEENLPQDKTARDEALTKATGFSPYR